MMMCLSVGLFSSTGLSTQKDLQSGNPCTSVLVYFLELLISSPGLFLISLYKTISCGLNLLSFIYTVILSLPAIYLSFCSTFWESSSTLLSVLSTKFFIVVLYSKFLTVLVLKCSFFMVLV